MSGVGQVDRGEVGGGTVFETFYTLNLSNGKRYFKEKLRAWHKEEGISGLQGMYRTLTKRFLFNEYIIKDEFDVFVAFETMNNRGKTLSDLELLKNRLIYLTTLYTRCGAGSCRAERSPQLNQRRLEGGLLPVGAQQVEAAER